MERVSSIIINESSDPDDPFMSDIDQDPVAFDAFQRSLKTMILSQNKTDKRFIDLHRVN